MNSLSPNVGDGNTDICSFSELDNAVATGIDGEKVKVEASGWLPQSSTTTNNYIGKSNWTNETSQYENKNELFNGSVFDVRGYKVPLSEKVIKDSIVWGKDKLGLF